jgi:hypothetical protein
LSTAGAEEYSNFFTRVVPPQVVRAFAWSVRPVKFSSSIRKTRSNPGKFR